jgi:hypothetical protein
MLIGSNHMSIHAKTAWRPSVGALDATRVYELVRGGGGEVPWKSGLGEPLRLR